MIKDVRTARNWREKLFFIFGNPERIARFKEERNADLLTAENAEKAQRAAEE
jgi:hypothetical protein